MTANTADPKSPFLAGFRDCLGLPAIGLFAALCGYGVQARYAGLDLWATLVTVVVVWAMPALMAFVEVFSAGGGPWLIFAAVGIVNLRTLPMVVSTIPLLRSGSGFRWSYLLWAQLVSPTSWVQINVFGPKLPTTDRAPYFAGFSLLLLAGGLVGAAIGHAVTGDFHAAIGMGLLFLTPMFVLLTMATAPRFSSQVSLVLGCVLLPPLMVWDAQLGMIVGGIGAGTLGFAGARMAARRGKTS